MKFSASIFLAIPHREMFRDKSSYKFDRNQYRIAFLAFKTSLNVLFDFLPQDLSPSRGADSDTHNRLIETLITVTLTDIGSLSRRAPQQQRFHLPFEALQLRNYEIRARARTIRE